MSSRGYSFVDGKAVPVAQTSAYHSYADMPSRTHDESAYHCAWAKTPVGKRSRLLWEAKQYDLGVRVSLPDSAAVKQGASGTDSGFLFDFKVIDSRLNSHA
jgi:hypothetical protein